MWTIISINNRAYLGAISRQPVRTLRREFHGWLLHLPSNGTAWCSLRGVVVEWGCSGWQHCVPPWLLAHSRELRSTVFIVFCSAPNRIQRADCLDFARGITNNYARKKVLRLKLTVLVLTTLYTFVTMETVVKLLSWITRKLVNNLYWLEFVDNFGERQGWTFKNVILCCMFCSYGSGFSTEIVTTKFSTKYDTVYSRFTKLESELYKPDWVL